MSPGSVGFDSHTTHSQLEFPPAGITITNALLREWRKPAKHRKNEMKTIQTATILIALVAMISMTGLAMADSVMDYTVDFGGVGDGSFRIDTMTPAGNDVQIAEWTNCEAGGYQDGSYGFNGDWTVIDRETAVTGIQNGDVAGGSIYTRSEMLSDGIYIPGSVTTYATYHDNNAGGSYVYLDQKSGLYDADGMPNVGCDGVGALTWINGYAYGDVNTHVSGSVTSTTDGTNGVSTSIGAKVHDGYLEMDVGSGIADDEINNEGSATDFTIYIYDVNSRADGYIYGEATVNGVIQPPVQDNSVSMSFKNADEIYTDGMFLAWTPDAPIPCAWDLLTTFPYTTP